MHAVSNPPLGLGNRLQRDWSSLHSAVQYMYGESVGWFFFLTLALVGPPKHGKIVVVSASLCFAACALRLVPVCPGSLVHSAFAFPPVSSLGFPTLFRLNPLDSKLRQEQGATALRLTTVVAESRTHSGHTYQNPRL